VIPGHSSGFREFKIYDKARGCLDWASFVSPTQCVVFFKDAETAATLFPDGTPLSKTTDCTVLVFDHLEEARRFCETRVAEQPSLCCEIYDCDGKAKSPLFTIVHPSMAEKDELSPTWVQRRKVAAVLCFFAVVLLVAWDWRAEWELMLPTVIAINLFFFGLRLLYWNTGRGTRDQEKARRIEDHLRRESDSISNSSDTSVSNNEDPH
jgi:hypothetical protein